MTTRHAPPVRVLTRPPIAPPPPSPSDPPPPPPPPPAAAAAAVLLLVARSFPERRGGRSRRPERRLLVAAPQQGPRSPRLRVGRRRPGPPLGGDGAKEWFGRRRVSYYYDEERGVLYLQFCSTSCPAALPPSEVASGFDSFVEEGEFGDLQGLLFMFSVCHIIIHLQEGSHFDTQILKSFRILQAAKQALAPFPLFTTFPQCTPVILFVFVDDYLEVAHASSHVEEASETSSVNVSANLSSSSRSALPTNAPGSVVVLARPISKSEGGFKKRLQSSLEAQIRFLIKKCRTLSGSETSHAGSRGGASSSAPLFLLDASRAVVLLDRSTTRSGESLEFAMGLVEDVLNGKATSDSLLLESHSQSNNKEDITSIKEFIHRQSDVLRGRGGLVANTNGGSAAGVGMVAVAAAAAAASAASGKAVTAPELPSLESWLSSSKIVLHGILTGKRGCIDEIEVNKRKPRQRNINSPQVEGIALKGAEPVDVAVSWLERGKGLNMKFSTSWCQKALPSAREIYLKDLPACYSTSQHETHLAKALHAFRSMVKGPAVQHFLKMLKDECVSIWTSGRQLCDAVSLTGKPCVHQRHSIEGVDSLSADAKPHSSGYVFLHACPCGRTRRLRADHFDFKSANDVNCSSDCEKLLPALQIPETSNREPINASSWRLLRLGNSKYYDPSKGLLQSGFHATEKYLLKWTIYLEKQKKMDGSPPKTIQPDDTARSDTDPVSDCNASTDMKWSINMKSYPGHVQHGNDNSGKTDDIFSDSKTISFGRGFPNFMIKRPFSEVVAGSAAADSAFPPLQQRKQSPLVKKKVIKQITAEDSAPEQIHTNVDHNASNRFQGSNVIPVNTSAGEKVSSKTSLKNVSAYLGFEYECPHGHRFLLNRKFLDELGSLYSPQNDSDFPPSDVTSDSSQLDENGGHNKVQLGSDGIASTRKKLRNMNKSKEILANGNSVHNQSAHLPGKRKEHYQTTSRLSRAPEFVEDLGERLHSFSLDNGGCAPSLLNRKLPIYMSCPHCKLLKKKDTSNVQFASTISQLQRIFLVTPPFPVILAIDPVVQFEASCLPSSIPDCEQKLQFNLGCQRQLVLRAALRRDASSCQATQVHGPLCGRWIREVNLKEATLHQYVVSLTSASREIGAGTDTPIPLSGRPSKTTTELYRSCIKLTRWGISPNSKQEPSAKGSGGDKGGDVERRWVPVLVSACFLAHRKYLPRLFFSHGGGGGGGGASEPPKGGRGPTAAKSR
ncbi:hypothetical protein NL676_004823 [Syzygium grande]|nr:hypothetical protein NL676_004823 [Syzygium grande]